MRLEGSNFIVDHIVPGESVQCVLSRAQHEVNRSPLQMLHTSQIAVFAFLLPCTDPQTCSLQSGIDPSAASTFDLAVQAPDMTHAIAAAVDRAVAAGSLQAEDGAALLHRYKADLAGYTYLSG